MHLCIHPCSHESSCRLAISNVSSQTGRGPKSTMPTFYLGKEMMGRADLLEGTACHIGRPDFGHLVCIHTKKRCDWPHPEHLLHFFLKPTMLREVRNFPSLTLGLVSLQHLGHNTLHIEYAAVLRTQPRDPSNPMSIDCRAAHTMQKCVKYPLWELAEEMEPT